MTPTQEAIQAWRQLLSELGSAATMRSGGDAGQRSAHRVNAVRELYYKVLIELQINKHLEIGSMHADASRRFMQANPIGKAIAYEAAPRNYEKAVAKPCPSGSDRSQPASIARPIRISRPLMKGRRNIACHVIGGAGRKGA